MATSTFDDLMTGVAIPALQTVFGIAATHTDGDSTETAVTIMLNTELAPVGEYGERMEARSTIEVPVSYGAVVGDTFTVAGDESDTVWQAVQLLRDDGLLRTFAVRDVST